MIKKIAFTLVLLTVLFSCKKDRLDGEYSVLTGKWKLDYIVKVERTLTSGTLLSLDTLYFPSEIIDSYCLEFFENGKLEQIKNDERVRKDRIVFHSFGNANPNSQYDFACQINLNNNEDDAIGMGFTETKMSTSQIHISDDFGEHETNSTEVSFEYIYFKQ